MPATSDRSSRHATARRAGLTRRGGLQAMAAAAVGLIGTTTPTSASAQTGPFSAAWVAVPAARAILVVAHPDFAARSLGRGELAALFLRTRNTLADGTPVQVCDAQDAALREAFYLALVGRSAVQMHAYWSRMVFSGAGRPPPQLDSAALQGQLRADPAMLGYAAAGQELRGLRVLFTLELSR